MTNKICFKVKWDGEWINGVGRSTGEECEQVFSFLSRASNTTKYQRPESMKCIIIIYSKPLCAIVQLYNFYIYKIYKFKFLKIIYFIHLYISRSTRNVD